MSTSANTNSSVPASESGGARERGSASEGATDFESEAEDGVSQAVAWERALPAQASPMTWTKEVREERVKWLRNLVQTRKSNPKRARKRGVFMVYGPPGAGKSEQIAHAFQRSFHLITQADINNFYVSQVETGAYPDERGLPKREELLRKYVQAQIKEGKHKGKFTKAPVDTRERLLYYVNSAAEQAAQARFDKKPLKYWNFIIDEFGALLERVYWQFYFETYSAEREAAQKGAYDSFGAFGAAKSWCADFMEQLYMLNDQGMNVGLVAHEREKDMAKKSGPQAGGPLLISKNTMALVTGMCSWVIRRYIQDDVNGWGVRKNACYNSQWQLSKARGLKAEDLYLMEDFSVEDIVYGLGYEANYRSDEDCLAWAA